MSPDGIESDGFTVHDVPPGDKPRLLVDPYDPYATVGKLRDILAGAGILFDRGVPVRLAYDQTHAGNVAYAMTPSLLILLAHQVCRPYQIHEKKDGLVEVNARLSKDLAQMYLDWRGEWRLKPFNGIASTPLLHEDGTVHHHEGYDEVSGMWCENVPDLAGLVPDRPTQQQAQDALRLIRATFATFCYADATMICDPLRGVAVVDTARPAGKDESSFLNALLTAVCRPSLHLAPAVLLRAA
jgi:hypothetical protein